MDESGIRKHIRESYGNIARTGDSCGCGCGTASEELARAIGYSEEELKATPDEANLGLGCGNPTALAGLKEGEVVLDLGSGAGFDCFLAAGRVGPGGKVIGVDMTPEMVEKARANAEKSDAGNVEFRLGEIENLPVEDGSVDVVISNCVLNLSLDKQRVFEEIVRVLKPGGRVAISDIALLQELPESITTNIEALVGCVSGALLVESYQRVVEESCLQDVKMTVKAASSYVGTDTNDPLAKALSAVTSGDKDVMASIASVYVEAHKAQDA